MIVTYTRDGASIDVDVPDEKCDALLDYLAARMPANPEMDARFERVMLRRAEAEAALSAPQFPKKTKRRGRR